MSFAKKAARSRRALAVGIAVLLVPIAAAGAPLLMDRPQEPVLAKASLQWPDGLNHFILTPDSVVHSTASSTTEYGLPEGATLTHAPDGKALVLLADGRLVPLSETDERSSPEPSDEPIDSVLMPGQSGSEASRAFAAAAETWPGVEKATPLAGGLISIATAEPRSAFETRAGVGLLHEDMLLQIADVATGTPNDPAFGTQWMHDNTGASSQAGGHPGVVDADASSPEAWVRSTGQGVVVADIDSGVDTAHPDLRDNLWRNTDEICGNGIDDDANGYVDDCWGWDAGSGDNNPAPDVGGSFGAHGTHVGGIIAATGDNGVGLVGMAPDARIMALKIASGNNLSTGAIVTAVTYAVDNGADIINASWGSPPGVSRASAWPIEQAVSYAASKDVLFVAAAGNDNANLNLTDSWPASFSKFYDNVVTVGASTNSDTKASFSNHGSNVVDVFGPGWFINSTMPGGGYAMMSGTSMAAPAVAGISALVAAAELGLGAAQLKERLLDTVDDVSALRGFSSSGRVNAASAVGVPSGDFEVDFVDFDGHEPDKSFDAKAVIATAAPEVVTGTTQLLATVVTSEGGNVYAVSGLQVRADLDDGSVTRATDDAGIVVLPGLRLEAGGSVEVDFELAFPTGNYGLLLQPARSDGTVVANGSAVFFAVGQPAPVAPPGGSTGPGSGSGSGGSVTPPGKAPGAGAPGGGTTAPGPGSGSNTGGPTGGGAPDKGTTAPGSGSGSNAGGSGGSTGAPPPPGKAPGVGAPGGGTTAPGSGSGSNTGGPTGGGTPGGGTAAPGSGTGKAPGAGAPGGGTTAPTSPKPAPVRNGAWEISSVMPNRGDAGGNTLVQVWGAFPDHQNAYVFVGGTRARVAYSSSWVFLVYTSAHVPGTVGVTVNAPGMSLTMPGAFTYVSSAGASSGGSGGGSGGGSSPNTPSPPASGGGSSGGSGGSGGGSGGSGGGSPSNPQVPGPSPLPEKTRGDLRLVPAQPSAFTQLAASAFPNSQCAKTTCRGIPVFG